MKPRSFGGPRFESTPSSGAVSERMSRTRGRDTAPEIALRSELHRRGLRFRVDRPLLPGIRRRADIVFSRAGVAVFVDGCFWHSCPQHGTWPKRNAAFWREKIEANVARDRDTDERLRRAGWEVVRVWEHRDPFEAADEIQTLLRRRSVGAVHHPADTAPS